MAIDPVYEEGDKWYFYDETWAYSFGPYDTEENARKNLSLYCDWLNSEPPDSNFKPHD